MVTVEHSNGHITGISVTGFPTDGVFEWAQGYYSHDEAYALAEASKNFGDLENLEMYLTIKPNANTWWIEQANTLSVLQSWAEKIRDGKANLYDSWEDLEPVITGRVKVIMSQASNEVRDVAQAFEGLVCAHDIGENMWQFAFEFARPVEAPDGRHYVLAFRK